MNLIEMLKSYKKTKSIREAHDICEYLSTLFDCELSCNTAEPLIKDEKIRKAVRAWAEAIEKDRVQFDRTSQGFSFSDGNVFSLINFDGFVFDLLDGKKYTISELCGEEEE